MARAIVTPESGDTIPSLIGCIYDDAVAERAWSNSLAALRNVMSAHTIALQADIPDRTPSTVFFVSGDRAEPSHIAEWEHIDYLTETDLRLPVGGVSIVNDCSRLGGQAYRNILRRYNVGRFMTADVGSIDGVQYSLHVARSAQSAPFSQKEAALCELVSSHFARAAGIRTRLANAQIARELQGNALDRLAIGGIIVEPGGRIIILNRTAQKILEDGDGLSIQGGALRAASAADDRLLQTSLTAALAGDVEHDGLAAGDDLRLVRAVSIRRPSGQRDWGLVVNARRMRNLVSDRWQFGALVFVRDPESTSCREARVFRQLFDFTRAEAKIAVELSSGRSIEEIQAALNIRYNTVRAHLRTMYLKTGVSRHADLVRVLVNGIAPLAPVAPNTLSGPYARQDHTQMY